MRVGDGRNNGFWRNRAELSTGEERPEFPFQPTTAYFSPMTTRRSQRLATEPYTRFARTSPKPKFQQKHHMSIPSTMQARQHKFVIFDFETTGLNYRKDHIFEIGAIAVYPCGKQEHFTTMLRTPVPISPGASRVTGVEDHELDGKPVFAEVLPDLLRFLDNAYLVGHNAAFDLRFLKESCRQHGVDIDIPTVCTLKMARSHLPEADSHKLGDVVHRLNLPTKKAHRALADCEMTLAVYLELLDAAMDEDVTIGELSDFMI